MLSLVIIKANPINHPVLLTSLSWENTILFSDLLAYYQEELGSFKMKQPKWICTASYDYYLSFSKDLAVKWQF